MKPDSVRKPDFLHHQLFLYFFLKSWRTPLTPSSARAIVSKNKNYCLASTRKSSIFLVRPPFVSSNGRGWHRRRLKVAAALAGLSLSVSMSDKSGIFLFCFVYWFFASWASAQCAPLSLSVGAIETTVHAGLIEEIGHLFLQRCGQAWVCSWASAKHVTTSFLSVRSLSLRFLSVRALFYCSWAPAQRYPS